MTQNGYDIGASVSGTDSIRRRIESNLRSDPSDSDSSFSSGEKKKFKCSLTGCKARFSKNRKLINHIRRHNGERPFKCDYPGCLKCYTNSSHLLRHKKTTHEARAEYVICQHEGCGQKFLNNTNLKRHFNRKHNPARFPFTCKECSMGFTKKNRLLKHEYVHTGKPGFKCDICGTYFTDEYSCNKHRRHHKLYICTCGKQFAIWSILLQHKKICKTELTCKICSKVFTNKSNLRNHHLIHDDENRAEYVCGYDNCTRKYQFKKNLVQHIQTTHMPNTERIPCPQKGCTADFKSQLCLKRHLKLHEKSKPMKAKGPRKPRRDKGIPTKSMASVLSGIDLTREEHKTIIEGSAIDLPTSITAYIETENSESPCTSTGESQSASDDKELRSHENTLRVAEKVKQCTTKVVNLTTFDGNVITENRSEISKPSASALSMGDQTSDDDDQLLRESEQSLELIKRYIENNFTS